MASRSGSVQSIDVSLLGDAKLIRAFNGIPIAVQKRLLKKAMRPAAKIVQARAKALAPRDTGKLARHLTVRALKRSRTKIGVRVMTGKRHKLGIDANSRWYYPAHVELGTKHRPATPYLRPALHENKSRVLVAIRRGLWSLLREEAARA